MYITCYAMVTPNASECFNTSKSVFRNADFKLFFSNLQHIFYFIYQEYGALFYETSAKSGLNVPDALQAMAR